MKTTLKAAVIALGAITASPAPAQDTISATHVFPASLIYSRSFLEFVKKANEAGKGVYTIQVRGGPEAIGMMEQPGAVRSGVVDMVYSACAFYAAVVPECDAVSASSIDGPTARKNGGTAFLNEIHQKRMGTYLLGWVDSGIRFNLWSTKEPKFDGDRAHRHQGLQGARQPDLQRVPDQLPRRPGHQPQLARAVHRARARHGRSHRLDADRH